MQQCKERVADQHSRPGKSHDLSNGLPHFGFVAMDGAFRAGRLFHSVAAGKKPLTTVFPQLIAGRAKIPRRSMAPAAIEANHVFNGFLFPLDSVHFVKSQYPSNRFNRLFQFFDKVLIERVNSFCQCPNESPKRLQTVVHLGMVLIAGDFLDFFLELDFLFK